MAQYYNEHIYSEELLQEYLYDKEVELPTRPYKGNCSKEFCDKLVDMYFDREFQRIQDIDFPDLLEYEITDQRCINELHNIITKDRSIKTPSFIIKRFHYSIIYASRDTSLSPYEGWQFLKKNKEAFRKFYANRLRCSDWFKEKENWKYMLDGFVPEFIYCIGLNTSKTYPFVSYFKPDLAKYIVKKYLNEYDTVFDPFSGYSSRMLGVLCMNKNYIGQDLCEMSVKESIQLYKFIKPLLEKEFGHVPTCDLSVKDSIKAGGKYECLMTCSPYENIENWPGVESKGYSCDMWIDICLSRYDCEKYVFVVDNKIQKYKKYIVETINNTSHFGNNTEYIICITKDDLKDITIDNYQKGYYDKYEGIYDFESETSFSKYMTYLYNVFNKSYFDRYVTCPSYMKDWISMIYMKFNQVIPYFIIDDNIIKHVDIQQDNNKILLGFSGGLDSTYQMLKLCDKYNKENVLLFHVRNINKYENGQSYKAVQEISKKTGVPLYVVNFKSVSTGVYKKEVPENPIKNQYIISLMVDYCYKNNITYISMGDPFNLPIEDATAGINLTDANEVTLMFLDIIKHHICSDVKHLDMIDYVDRLKELEYIRQKGLQDVYYTCITAGRLNQYLHDLNEKKYNIKLDKHNCGCNCRKCATLNLLEHYDNNKPYPKNFIDKCWEILWKNNFSSEYFQFNSTIPLEQRIKNLHTT